MVKRNTIKKDERYLVCLFLRIGIAFTFLYAAISSFLNPGAWIGFFPGFATAIISANILLPVFSIYEIFLALWLFSNKKIYYAAIVSAITIFSVVIFNIGALDIVFRDIAILFSAIALAILTKKDSD